MAPAAQCAAPTPKRYLRRRPERTLWYRIVQTHLETWLEFASGEEGEAPPAHAERTFRRYLECGIVLRIIVPSCALPTEMQRIMGY
jgi:hypothetical protein